ncbi:MAG: hypothetical protein ABI210_04560, partial [Abditibacteriaceae bacterium]
MNKQLGTTKIGQPASANAMVQIQKMDDNPDPEDPNAKFTYTWSLGLTTQYQADPTAPWQTLPTTATISDKNAVSTNISTDFDTPGIYKIILSVS